MNACEYLARVGFDALLDTPSLPDDEDDPASVEEARLRDHAAVRLRLLSAAANPMQGRDGAKWLGTISWPDRVPGLKTWAGQMTLPKIIGKLQRAVESAEDGDLHELRVPLKGATGLDALTSLDALDVGFSPAALDMAVVQRPALELLAIYGLERVPLVSYGYRECGIVHDGRVWRWPVEARDGGYLYRWGQIREWAAVEVPA